MTNIKTNNTDKLSGVVIDGAPYNSLDAASKELGYSSNYFHRIVKGDVPNNNGHIIVVDGEKVMTRNNSIVVNGTKYNNRQTASTALGYAPNYITRLIKGVVNNIHGHEIKAWVGDELVTVVSPNTVPTDNVSTDARCKSVTVNGVFYKNRSAASRALGHSPNYITRVIDGTQPNKHGYDIVVG